jgi:hypothetical protein
VNETTDRPDYKEQLKVLRERRGEAIQRINKLRQEHHALHTSLLAAMEAGPKTVPELAAAVSKPAQEVLWHLMALKKYNRVVEDKKQGEYVGYRKKN